jgi:hypothetical protein
LTVRWLSNLWQSNRRLSCFADAFAGTFEYFKEGGLLDGWCCSLYLRGLLKPAGIVFSFCQTVVALRLLVTVERSLIYRPGDIES